MKPLVENSDVLVHEATFGPILSDLQRSGFYDYQWNWEEVQEEWLQNPKNKSKWESIVQKAAIYQHSTLDMVGQFAQEVKAKNLILTHIGGRYDGKSAKTLKALTHIFCGRVRKYFGGKVDMAYDGFTYTF